MATHEEPKHYHFSNECNMINRIVLGMDTRQFREENRLDKSIGSIRPYLMLHQIQAVKALQRIDIGLVVAVRDFQERKRLLEQQYERIQRKQLPA
jgi:hypothetical protein